MSDKLAISTIRALAADMVQAANSGHPGMPLGMAPVAHLLWKDFLSFDSQDPSWLGRDRFVLSNGHGCALLYTMLHLSGYDIPLEQLKKFRHVGSITAGHPERGLAPGVEVTTGPLGQGIANAVGMAIAQSNLNARFPGLFENHVYVFMGDGCMMEGVGQEALSLAGHMGLSNLVAIYDDNKISIDGSTELAFTEDVRAKMEACGWHVITVEDGNDDLESISRALEEARAPKDKPTLIQLRTIIGYLSPVAGTEKAHGAPLGEDGLKQLKVNMGLNPEEKFAIPADVYELYAASAERGRSAHREWDAKVEAFLSAGDAAAVELRSLIKGELPEGWKDALPVFEPGKDVLATRQCSQKVLNSLSTVLPSLIGGSADLTPSNLTLPTGWGDYQKATPEGRYLRFGVREHAMAAISNGIAAYGCLIPFAGTFLNFIGYAAGAVRLSALSELGVIYVATHDSIGLGEDGPTHQPIEIIPMLRALPNLLTFRPADGNETAGCYAYAVEARNTPSVIALSRQGLPTLDRSSSAAVAQGAYVAVDTDGKPDAILLASGSEVSLCVDVAKSSDLKVRVVSMPCMELFLAQDRAYKSEVLPAGVPVLAVEAQGSFGLDKVSHGQHCMESFGASGPVKEVMAHFGFTVEAVADHTKRMVEFYQAADTPPAHDLVNKF